MEENREQNFMEENRDQKIPRQVYTGTEYTQELDARKAAEKERRAEIFSALALPTLLYALVYTVLLYDNFASVTMPLFVGATTAYVFHVMKVTGVERKKHTRWYVLVMVLLGISDMLTGSAMIQTFNNIGIFLLLVCMLLYNYVDVSKWGLGQYLAGILSAVFGAVGSVFDPFADGEAYFSGAKKGPKGKGIYILLGVVIALPLLAVVTVLLYFADAVFANFLRESLRLDAGTVFLVLLFFVFAFFSAYCGMRYLGKGQLEAKPSERKKWEPLIAITVTLLISVVYVIFSGIQILYLFWGKMELPEGYTYAEYAREGFFQLLFVCIINVILVLFIQSFFREHVALKLLLTLICACTYIMVASSAMRMLLYIGSYHLTVLRVLVLWALAVIALLLAGILLAIWKTRFPLFGYGLVVISGCYLVLSFSHMDYFIARYNLAHMDQKEQDLEYLTSLSTDAAPALYDVLMGEEVESHYRNAYAVQIAETTDDSLRQFNVSRAYARNLYADTIREATRQFEMEIVNDTIENIRDVAVNYYQGEELRGSVTNADEGELLYLANRGDIESTDGSDRMILTLTRADLETMGIKEENLSDFGISVSFRDEEGTLHETDITYFAPEPGKYYQVLLSGDETYGYSLYGYEADALGKSGM